MRANVVLRFLRLPAQVLGAALALAACTSTPAPPSADCTPSCQDRCGEADGCGGTCACDKPTPVSDCSDTCESLDRECGEVCGQSCGTCSDREYCEEGRCECRPVCDGTRCDDGCGGLCECAQGTVCDLSGACKAPDACKDTCAAAGRQCGEVCGKACGSCAESEVCLEGACTDPAGCVDCMLRLELIDRKVSEGRIHEVTLAVLFAPGEGQARPRMADVRIKASRDVELTEVTPGAALSMAEKELYKDERTGKSWQRRPDGSYQILALGTANTKTFEPGRVLTLKFRVDELGPVAFSLVRREQTLAPSDADVSLQSSPYDQAVVVSR